MDEQTAIGRAIQRLVVLGRAPAVAADEVLSDTARFVELERLVESSKNENGSEKASRVLERPAPSHALDAPPDLTDATVDGDLLGAIYRSAAPAAPFAAGGVCECGFQRALTERGKRVCLNEECPRYEEVLQ